MNQLTTAGSTPLGYDGRGNLTSSGASAYGYNLLNQMTSASTGANWLEYGALDQLQGLNLPNGTYPRFASDGANIIAEYQWSPSAPTTLQRRYVYGPGSDEPVVWYEGTGTSDRRWLHADERGSVVAVSDASGAVLAINRYDEYGIPSSINMGRFQYTGQAWLPEVGMYYYKARMYSPTLGRFMQTDPIGYGDGLNWYNYVGSDPVNKVDPSGLVDAIVVNGIRSDCDAICQEYRRQQLAYFQSRMRIENELRYLRGGSPIQIDGLLDIDFDLGQIIVTACRVSEQVEAVADGATELGLFAAGSGAVVGGATGGLGGAAAMAAPGLTMAAYSSEVSATAQLVADVTQVESREQLANAFVRASINFGGGKFAKAIVKPFVIGPWLDRAQQNLRNETVGNVVGAAGELVDWLDPNYGC